MIIQDVNVVKEKLVDKRSFNRRGQILALVRGVQIILLTSVGNQEETLFGGLWYDSMTSKSTYLQTSFHGTKAVESRVDIKVSYLSDTIAEINKFNNSIKGSYHRVTGLT
jgi:hypothetical protein